MNREYLLSRKSASAFSVVGLFAVLDRHISKLARDVITFFLLMLVDRASHNPYVNVTDNENEN